MTIESCKRTHCQTFENDNQFEIVFVKVVRGNVPKGGILVYLVAYCLRPNEEDAITPVVKAHVDVILIHGQDFSLRSDLP